MTNTMDTCSTREAATLLGVSVRAAQLWVEQGRLQAWKTPGGHRRILRRSVEAMLAQRRQETVSLATPFEVLVVEDDPVQRLLYEETFRKLGPGVSLRSATTGIEGLIRIGERRPDLLITDLMMPGVDGFEMLETLRSGVLAQPMHIVVATALDDDDLRERGGLPPGVTLFHKPVPLKTLLNLVETCRNGASARKETP